MARVAFFVEDVPPTEDRVARFAYSLAKALAEQQHEILIFSTERPGHPGPLPMRGVQIARPFRQWGWLEAARAAPAVARFAPDVLHFVQPHAEASKGWTNAMSALPAIVRAAMAATDPLRGWPATVVSLFDAREGWMQAAKALIAQADAVTASEPELLHSLRPSLPRALAESTALLPLTLAFDSSLDRPSSESAFAGHAGAEPDADADVLSIPGNLDEHADLDLLFQALAIVLRRHPNAIAAATGSWGRVPPRRRFALLRLLGEHAGRFSARGGAADGARADAVFAATLGANGLRLAEATDGALKQSAFLVVSENQARLDATKPGPWLLRAEENAEALAEAALLALRSPRNAFAAAAEDARRSAADDPANVVSRLYSRILVGRSRF